MKREFIRTPTFERCWEQAGLNDDDLRQLENILLDNPQAGAVIPHLNGATGNFDYFAEMKASLEEALAFKNGDKSKGKLVTREGLIPAYSAKDVVRVRENLHLTRVDFAYALGVTSGMVEDWESGRDVPQGPSRRLLYLIERDSSLADELTARCPCPCG